MGHTPQIFKDFKKKIRIPLFFVKNPTNLKFTKNYFLKIGKKIKIFREIAEKKTVCSGIFATIHKKLKEI